MTYHRAGGLWLARRLKASPVRPAGSFVNKQRLKASQAFTDSETIAALKRVVEDPRLAAKIKQLEGIIAEEGVGSGWKIKEPGGHRRPYLRTSQTTKLSF
jgi:hypothetical protein